MRTTIPSVSDFEKVTNGVKSFSKDVEINVDFDLSDSLFEDYINEEASVLVLNADPAATLDAEEIKNFLTLYLAVLLGMRVDYVQGLKVPFKPEDPQYTIPAFFSLVLGQIGRVMAGSDVGYTLQPSLVVKDYWKAVSELGYYDNFGVTQFDDEGKRKWLRAASRKVRRWYNLANMHYADAMPKSKDGSLDLMLMHIVEHEVTSDTGKRHPLFALCAAVVGVHQRFTCALFASSYGTFNMLRNSLVKVTDLEARYGSNS